MLVLTRRVGESIRIGDGVRLTVLSTLRAHTTVSLIVPVHITIADDADTPLQPMKLRERDRRYRVAMMAGDSLRIETGIVVCFGGYLPTTSRVRGRGQQVRIGIHAPREVPVHREEVYWRIKRGEPVACRGRH